MSIMMPPDANIPHEWTVGRDAEKLIMVVPSWSRKSTLSYTVIMDLETRELVCECKGFQFRQDCHHVRGLVWFCAGPRFRRKGMQRTSISAWESIQVDLGLKQKLVYDTLALVEEASNKDLVNLLGWPINTITPRVLELRNMGLVECAGEKYDNRTNRSELTWKAVA